MKKRKKILVLNFMLLIVAITITGKYAIGIAWILFHELIHIFVASRFGCKLYNINLNIFGANAGLINVDDLSLTKKIIVYASGPIFNLLVALVFLIVGMDNTNQLIEDSLMINLTLGVMNLLPAYPLDGGVIYESLLSKKLLYKRAKKIVGYASYLVGILFLVLGCITIIHKVNISLFLTSALITYTTFIDREKTMYIMMENIIKKRTKIIKGEYIENKSISIYYKTGLVKIMGLVDKNKFNTFYILDEEMRLLKIIHEDEIIEALKEFGNITIEEYIDINKQ